MKRILQQVLILVLLAETIIASTVMGQSQTEAPAEQDNRQMIFQQIGSGQISIDFPIDPESMNLWNADSGEQPITITFSEDYALANGMILPKGSYYIFGALQEDSTAFLYFDKLHEGRKYSGKPEGMIKVEFSESPADKPEGLMFTDNNELLINIHNKSFARLLSMNLYP